MILLKVKLINFRNYKETEIHFHPGINVLFGRNGQGKTNILESLYYLSLTKSFRTNSDQNLVLNGSDFFRVQGNFVSDQEKAISSAIAYSPVDGKRLNFNGQKLQKFSDYIGSIPIVLLSPSDLEISQSGPYRRRQFLDIMLSQSSQLYLHHLLEYRRALKQRNALLQTEYFDKSTLQAWNESLVKNGAIIMEMRKAAIDKLDQQVKSHYRTLSGSSDNTKIIYQYSFPLKNSTDISGTYRSALEQAEQKDRQSQTTSIGPHRDDLLFLINGKPLRVIGSQGEHKTFVIALRIAEFYYLKSIHQEAPILLFDDIFGELDPVRIANMIDTLSQIGQVFITTTSANFFNKIESWQQETSFYEIINGSVNIREKV